MKVNSMENLGYKRKKVVFYIFMAIVLGVLAVLLFKGFVIAGSYTVNFISSYWHFIIMGIIALIFLRMWFKKKEVVIHRPVEDG